MTWREFANEVPTEARSVVVAWRNAEGDMRFAAHTLYPDEGGDYWITSDARQIESDGYPSPDWRRAADSNGWTAWRYIDPPGTDHPLAPLVSRLTSEWTRLHVPSQDWEHTGGRDALRGMVGVLARFLKVEMP